MSTTIIAVVVQLLSIGLPSLGITVGSEELTSAIQTLAIVASGLWIWFKRVQVGDVNLAGLRN